MTWRVSSLLFWLWSFPLVLGLWLLAHFHAGFPTWLFPALQKIYLWQTVPFTLLPFNCDCRALLERHKGTKVNEFTGIQEGVFTSTSLNDPPSLLHLLRPCISSGEFWARDWFSCILFRWGSSSNFVPALEAFFKPTWCFSFSHVAGGTNWFQNDFWHSETAGKPLQL